MNIQNNGYGSYATPSQNFLASVSDYKAPQDLANNATQARAQESANQVKETQTQQRVQAQEQTQPKEAQNNRSTGNRIDLYA